jgi:hypothetical protein
VAAPGKPIVTVNAGDFFANSGQKVRIDEVADSPQNSEIKNVICVGHSGRRVSFSGNTLVTQIDVAWGLGRSVAPVVRIKTKATKER